MKKENPFCRGILERVNLSSDFSLIGSRFISEAARTPIGDQSHQVLQSAQNDSNCLSAELQE